MCVCIVAEASGPTDKQRFACSEMTVTVLSLQGATSDPDYGVPPNQDIEFSPVPQQ